LTDVGEPSPKLDRAMVENCSTRETFLSFKRP
jgi:hypothetical protein